MHFWDVLAYEVLRCNYDSSNSSSPMHKRARVTQSEFCCNIWFGKTEWLKLHMSQANKRRKMDLLGGEKSCFWQDSRVWWTEWHTTVLDSSIYQWTAKTRCWQIYIATNFTSTQCLSKLCGKLQINIIQRVGIKTCYCKHKQLTLNKLLSITVMYILTVIYIYIYITRQSYHATVQYILSCIHLFFTGLFVDT